MPYGSRTAAPPSEIVVCKMETDQQRIGLLVEDGFADAEMASSGSVVYGALFEQKPDVTRLDIGKRARETVEVDGPIDIGMRLFECIEQGDGALLQGVLQRGGGMVGRWRLLIEWPMVRQLKYISESLFSEDELVVAPIDHGWTGALQQIANDGYLQGMFQAGATNSVESNGRATRSKSFDNGIGSVTARGKNATHLRRGGNGASWFDGAARTDSLFVAFGPTRSCPGVEDIVGIIDEGERLFHRPGGVDEPRPAHGVLLNGNSAWVSFAAPCDELVVTN